MLFEQCYDALLRFGKAGIEGRKRPCIGPAKYGMLFLNGIQYATIHPQGRKQKGNQSMKKQAFNPYLPSWEYIPDGETLCIWRPGVCVWIA